MTQTDTRTPEQIIRSIRKRCIVILRDDEGEPLLDRSGKPRRCGADFNEVILAGPLDGEQHTYTCPRCGTVGHYTAPWFPEPETPAVAAGDAG